jgi:hypothetical protein
MFCTVCGKWGDFRHFTIIDGEVYCQPSIEQFGIVDETFEAELEPFWFGGKTNEAGEVYGG